LVCRSPPSAISCNKYYPVKAYSYQHECAHDAYMMRTCCPQRSVADVNFEITPERSNGVGYLNDCAGLCLECSEKNPKLPLCGCVVVRSTLYTKALTKATEIVSATRCKGQLQGTHRSIHSSLARKFFSIHFVNESHSRRAQKITF
jgi:hypothetical protein